MTKAAKQQAVIITVESSSSPGTMYHMWVGLDGPIFCDCPGHKYARNGGVRKPCKHMRGVAQATLVEVRAQLAGITKGPGRFQVIEIEQDDTGGWVSVTDLQRFNNLEI